MRIERRNLLLGAAFLVAQILIFYLVEWATVPLGIVLGPAIFYGIISRNYLLAFVVGFLCPWTFTAADIIKIFIAFEIFVFPIVRNEDLQRQLTVSFVGGGAGLFMAWYWRRIIRQSREAREKAKKAEEAEAAVKEEGSEGEPAKTGG